MKLQDYKTWELVEELGKREGVETIVSPNPDSYYAISVLTNGSMTTNSDSGPATILIVID